MRKATPPTSTTQTIWLLADPQVGQITPGFLTGNDSEWSLCWLTNKDQKTWLQVFGFSSTDLTVGGTQYDLWSSPSGWTLRLGDFITRLPASGIQVATNANQVSAGKPKLTPNLTDFLKSSEIEISFSQNNNEAPRLAFSLELDAKPLASGFLKLLTLPKLTLEFKNGQYEISGIKENDKYIDLTTDFMLGHKDNALFSFSGSLTLEKVGSDAMTFVLGPDKKYLSGSPLFGGDSAWFVRTGAALLDAPLNQAKITKSLGAAPKFELDLDYYQLISKRDVCYPSFSYKIGHHRLSVKASLEALTLKLGGETLRLDLEQFNIKEDTDCKTIESRDGQLKAFEFLRLKFKDIKGQFNFVQGSMGLTSGDVALRLGTTDQFFEFKVLEKKAETNTATSETQIFDLDSSGLSFFSQAVCRPISFGHLQLTPRPDNIEFKNGRLVKGDFTVAATLTNVKDLNFAFTMRLVETPDGLAIAGIQQDIDFGNRVFALPELPFQLTVSTVSLKLDFVKRTGTDGSSKDTWDLVVKLDGSIALVKDGLNLEDLSDFTKPQAFEFKQMDVLNLGISEVAVNLVRPFEGRTFGNLLQFRVGGQLTISKTELKFQEIGISLQCGGFGLGGAAKGDATKPGMIVSPDGVTFPCEVGVSGQLGQVLLRGSFYRSTGPNSNVLFVSVDIIVPSVGKFTGTIKVGKEYRAPKWVPSIVVYGSGPLRTQGAGFAILDIGGGLSVNNQLAGLDRVPSAASLLDNIDRLNPTERENWKFVDYGDGYVSMILTATMAPTLSRSAAQPWFLWLLLSLDTDLRAVAACKLWTFSSADFLSRRKYERPLAGAAALLNLQNGDFKVAAGTKKSPLVERSNPLTKVLERVETRFSFALTKQLVDFNLEKMSYDDDFFGAKAHFESNFRMALKSRTLFLGTGMDVGCKWEKKLKGGCGPLDLTATAKFDFKAGFKLQGLMSAEGLLILGSINASCKAHIGYRAVVECWWGDEKFNDSIGAQVDVWGTMAIDTSGGMGMRGTCRASIKVWRWRPSISMDLKINTDRIEKVERRISAFKTELDSVLGFAANGNFKPMVSPGPQVTETETWYFYRDKVKNLCFVFPSEKDKWLKDVTELTATVPNVKDPVSVPFETADQTSPLWNQFYSIGCEGVATQGNILTDPRYFGQSSPYRREDDRRSLPEWVNPITLELPAQAGDPIEQAAFNYYQQVATLRLAQAAQGRDLSEVELNLERRGHFLFALQKDLHGGAPLTFSAESDPTAVTLKRNRTSITVTLSSIETVGSTGVQLPIFHEPCQVYVEDEKPYFQIQLPADYRDCNLENPPTVLVQRLQNAALAGTLRETPVLAENSLPWIGRTGQYTLISPFLDVIDTIPVDSALRAALQRGEAVPVTYTLKVNQENATEQTRVAYLRLPSASRIPAGLGLYPPLDALKYDDNAGAKTLTIRLLIASERGPQPVDLPPLDFWAEFGSPEDGQFGQSGSLESSQKRTTSGLLPLPVTTVAKNTFSFSLNNWGLKQPVRVFVRPKDSLPTEPVVPVGPNFLYTAKYLGEKTKFFMSPWLELWPAPPSGTKVPMIDLLDVPSYKDGAIELRWSNPSGASGGVHVRFQDVHEPGLLLRQLCSVHLPTAFCSIKRNLAEADAWEVLPFPKKSVSSLQTNLLDIVEYEFSKHYAPALESTSSAVTWETVLSLEAAKGRDYHDIADKINKFELVLKNGGYDDWATFAKQLGSLLRCLQFLFADHNLQQAWPELQKYHDQLLLLGRARLLGIQYSPKKADELSFEEVESQLKQIEIVVEELSQRLYLPWTPGGSETYPGRKAERQCFDILSHRRFIAESLVDQPALVALADFAIDSAKYPGNKPWQIPSPTTEKWGDSFHDALTTSDPLKKVLTSVMTVLRDLFNKPYTESMPYSLELTELITKLKSNQLSSLELSPTLIHVYETKISVETVLSQPVRTALLNGSIKDSDKFQPDWTQEILPTLRWFERMGLSVALSTGEFASVLIDGLKSDYPEILWIEPLEPSMKPLGYGFIQPVVLPALLKSLTAPTLLQWCKARGIEEKPGVELKEDSCKLLLAQIQRFLNGTAQQTCIRLVAQDHECQLLNNGGVSSLRLPVRDSYPHWFDYCVHERSRFSDLYSYAKLEEPLPSLPVEGQRPIYIPGRLPALESTEVFSRISALPSGDGAIQYAYELIGPAVSAQSNALSAVRTAWGGTLMEHWYEFDVAGASKTLSSWKASREQTVFGDKTLNIEKTVPVLEASRLRQGGRSLEVQQLPHMLKYRLNLLPVQFEMVGTSIPRRSEAVQPLPSKLACPQPTVKFEGNTVVLTLPLSRHDDSCTSNLFPRPEWEVVVNLTDNTQVKLPLSQCVDLAAGYRLVCHQATLKCRLQACTILLPKHPEYSLQPLGPNDGPRQDIQVQHHDGFTGAESKVHYDGQRFWMRITLTKNPKNPVIAAGFHSDEAEYELHLSCPSLHWDRAGDVKLESENLRGNNEE